MNYGEVKAQFRAMLNRRDITPSLVENFIKSAIQRAQRLLRVPASESVAYIPVEDGFDGLDIPGDFLKLVSLTIGDQELTKVDLTTALRESRYPGVPRFFARNGSKFIIGPRPATGDVIQLVYNADFSALTEDTDSNWLTEIAPDIIYNGALSLACGHYTDPRKQVFEDDFVKAIVDLNNQASEDELTNAQVMPAYSLNFDD